MPRNDRQTHILLTQQGGIPSTYSTHRRNYTPSRTPSASVVWLKMSALVALWGTIGAMIAVQLAR